MIVKILPRLQAFLSTLTEDEAGQALVWLDSMQPPAAIRDMIDAIRSSHPQLPPIDDLYRKHQNPKWGLCWDPMAEGPCKSKFDSPCPHCHGWLCRVHREMHVLHTGVCPKGPKEFRKR